MTARALLIVGVCAVAVTAMAGPLDEGGQSQRFSDAEKAFVPAQATVRVADGPRRANLQPVVGSKFAKGAGDQGGW